MIKYEVIKKFTLVNEILKDGRFIKSKFAVKVGSVWTWVAEEADMIKVVNENKDELTLDRYYFVQRFKRIDE